MALRTDEIVTWLRKVEQDEAYAALPAAVVVLDMLLQSLGPQEKQIYDLVVRHPGITSVEIGKAIDRPLNHVGNILGKLRNYGLVRSKVDSHYTGGILYEWECA